LPHINTALLPVATDQRKWECSGSLCFSHYVTTDKKSE
jgi:hypothetical protein